MLTALATLGLVGLSVASPFQPLLLPYYYLVPRGMPSMPMVEPVVVELETQFTCTAEGSFPDPESCNKYYQCNTMPDGELRVSKLRICRDER